MKDVISPWLWRAQLNIDAYVPSNEYSVILLFLCDKNCVHILAAMCYRNYIVTWWRVILLRNKFKQVSKVHFITSLFILYYIIYYNLLLIRVVRIFQKLRNVFIINFVKFYSLFGNIPSYVIILASTILYYTYTFCKFYIL